MVSIAIARALDRHRAFWHRAETDRPILWIGPWKDWQPHPPSILRDGTVLPDGGEIRPGLLDPMANVLPPERRPLLDGDLIGGRSPYDVCWTEAMLGCRVQRLGPSVWAEPFIRTWDDVDRLPRNATGGWLDELLAVNRLLLADSGGVYPVCQPLMRGPIDMAAAAVPTEMLYEGFGDHPKAMRILLDRCADVFVDAARRRLAETPAWNGGYVTRYEWGLWAPGPVVQTQADASRNISPDVYREFLFGVDRRVAGQFAYSIVHTHSGCRHILPVQVEEPELRAIEITLDPVPYGPTALEMLPWFKLVQAAGKPLMINGPMKRSELDAVLAELSPGGLAIRAGILAE